MSAARVDRADAETARLLKEIAGRTGLTRTTALRKAIAYWAPRVLSGEISLLEKPSAELSTSFVAPGTQWVPNTESIQNLKKGQK